MKMKRVKNLYTIHQIIAYLDDSYIKNLARGLKIRGRTTMEISQLRKVIENTLKDEEKVLEILRELPEDSLRILDILRDYDGRLNRKKIIQEFGKSYNTFRKYISQLLQLGLVFFDSAHDEYHLPKEILPIIDDFIMEKEEKMSFEDFLDNFLTIQQLRDICRFFNIPKSGKKDHLISRIKNLEAPKSEILSVLTVGELKDIAENLGLKKSGKKEEIIDRILEQIEVSKVKEYEVTTKRVKHRRKTTLKKSGIDALWEYVAEIIDKQFRPFKPVNARLKERQIEGSLYQFLVGKLEPEHKVEYEKEKGRGRIDLSIDGKIGIELKYNPYDYDKVVGQIERYSKEFSRIIVVICISGMNEKLITKANAAKARIESKGAKVIIKPL